MIREIRTLQPSDQNRLRDDHKHGGKGDFARYLQPADQGADSDETSEAAFRQQRPTSSMSSSLISNNMQWSQFFAQLGGNNANDSNSPLFSWGETRENAKRHAETARQSAKLNGRTPLHILNEKI